MADLISILTACGTEGLPSDPDFQNVTLLLHGDGTNGAQNNTFLDSSTNNFTITRNGNTTQGTFSPFSKPDGRWGTYYDGTDDYLSVADNAVLRPGAGAFTLEAWIYRNASGAAHTIYAKGGASTGISFLVTSGNVLRFTHTTTNIDSSGTVAANAWVHVAVVREGTGTNQTKLYINGTQDGQGTVTTDFTQTEEVRIGTNRGATDDFAGYISNVRFVKGSALYTGNFTPSTSPFTTTSQGASSSEVELLTCQSNRFIDNSTNNFTITRNGDVKVTPFSPFPITTAYSTATNGGSGYFDGTGDYLSIADNSAFEFGSGDFCVEFFAYVTATDSSGTIFVSQWSSPNRGWIFGYVNSGTTLNFDYSTTGSNAVSVNASVSLPLNQWAHFAACRSGNTLSTYMNGSRVATASVTGVTIFAPNQPLEIGRNPEATTAWDMIGYLSGMRIVKGSSVYDPTQTTLTVPTAPPTAISNTSVLLNYTNAGIFDNTGFNNLETVDNAQIDTSVKKYGTGSMEFDGTGDWLENKAGSPNLDLSSGDWTIEAWVYRNVSNAAHQIVSLFNSAGANSGLSFYINASNLLAIDNGVTGTTAAGTVNSGQWVHVAAVRSSGNTQLYVNGSAAGSVIAQAPNASQFLRVGITANGINPMNGYIDDLRITKGIARYTAAFTPPTAAFPDIGE